MSFLFPSNCILCNSASHRDLDLCIDCENDMPFLKNGCKCCAQPLSEGQIICGSCLNNSLMNSIKTFSLFYYKTPIKQLLLGLKFSDRLINAKVLGELMANYLYNKYIDQDKPEIIIPVPLHPERLNARGYNQALELARPIAKKLNIKINKSSVIRTKNTSAQALLEIKERVQNVKKAFDTHGRKLKQHKHVAVIDDVITTGNTATELCKLLHQNGINKIDVWCLAKAHF